jgi:hypothetical protein
MSISEIYAKSKYEVMKRRFSYFDIAVLGFILAIIDYKGVVML